MSKLKELIDHLCPDGVEYTTLGKVAEIKRGVRVVKSNLETQGDIPVYQNSLTPLGYYTKSNFPADTAFVIGAGAAGEMVLVRYLIGALMTVILLYVPLISLASMSIISLLIIKYSLNREFARQAYLVWQDPL